MGAIARKLTDAYKRPKAERPVSGRRLKTDFGPKKSSGQKLKSPSMAQARAMMNELDRAERQAVLLPARTEKFAGRLRNQGSISDHLDSLLFQADSLLGNLSGAPSPQEEEL